MKFREHGDLLSIILEGTDVMTLNAKVLEFGKTNEIIDLQYSSHFLNNKNTSLFSVFILYRPICIKTK